MPGRKRPPGGENPIDPTLLALRLRAAAGLHDEFSGRGGQKALAIAACVDEGNLSRMLRGLAGPETTAATIVLLARATDVTVGWLLAGEGGAEPVRVRNQATPTPPPRSSVAPKSA